MRGTKSRIFQSISIVLIYMLFSCGGNDGGEEELPNTQTLPTKAVGVLPANGEPCSDYEEVSNETKALILFAWNAAQFAQSYEVVVFESGTEAARKSATALETKIELDRGKTFTWQVIAMNSIGDTASNTYSFTSPGVPLGNYAPYAAQIIIEFDAESLEMSISWIGNDEDGDYLSYDVRIYKSEEMIQESLDIQGTFLEPVPYVPNIDYTIEVVSKDELGNYSISLLSISSSE